MKLLKNIAFVLVILLLITPCFVIHNIYDGKIWGPQYFFIIICTLLILVCSLFLFFKKTSLVFNLNKIQILVFFILLYIFINATSGYYLGAYVQYFYILCLLFFVILVIKSLIVNFASNKIILTIITVFILIALIEGIIGILQQKNLITSSISLFKVTGTFINPGDYSNYLSIAFTFSLGIYLYIMKKLKWLIYLSLFSIIITTTALYYANARTSWLASASGVVIVCWPYIKDKPIFVSLFSSIKRKIISFSILIITVIYILFYLYQYKIQSSEGRLLIYNVSLSMIKDKPIFGHGFCRFPAEYSNYQADFFKKHPDSNKTILADNVKTSFNEFIQITVELGIIGLLLIVFFIILLFRTKPKPGLKYIFLPAKGALFTVLICSLFSYPFRILPVAVYISFLLAFVIIGSTDIVNSITLKKQLYKPITIGIFLIALLFCFSQWKDYEARKKWQKAIDLTLFQEFQKALPYYRDAYKTLNYDGFFLYNYGSELIDRDPFKGIIILEEARKYFSDSDLMVYLADGYKSVKNYKKAEKAYWVSINMVPNRFYPRYQLFKLFLETNQLANAYDMAKKISIMQVKIPSTAVFNIKNDVDQWLANYKE